MYRNILSLRVELQIILTLKLIQKYNFWNSLFFKTLKLRDVYIIKREYCGGIEVFQKRLFHEVTSGSSTNCLSRLKNLNLLQDAWWPSARKALMKHISGAWFSPANKKSKLTSGHRNSQQLKNPSKSNRIFIKRTGKI